MCITDYNKISNLAITINQNAFVWSSGAEKKNTNKYTHYT